MVKEKASRLEETQQTQSEESKPKKSRKIPILTVLAFLFVVSIALGAYFFFSGKTTENTAKDTQTVNFGLEPFIVNLMDQNGKYLKVSIHIELSCSKIAEKAKNKTPQIRDAIITLLTNKTSGELITPEGKLFLKDEIKQRVNQTLGENSVINVYLTDFVMQ